MSKVKKRVGVTRRSSTSGASVRKSRSRNKRKADAAVSSRVPDTQFLVRELDPQAKCGSNTSVQFLHRVIERVEGRVTNHLVFFDQHGWYCEHGRACPAVVHAKKHIGWTSRDSE